MKNILTISFILLLLASGLMAQTAVRAIDDIKKEYQEFHYEKVLEKGHFYMGEPYLTHKDSLIILTYLLNASYKLDKIPESKQYATQILKLDADYNLDPKINSPKIISFFKEEKRKYILKNKKTHVINVPTQPKTKKQQTRTNDLWAGAMTILFPGSGHIIEKVNHKTYYRSLISAILLSGIVYQTIHTDQLKSDYLAGKSNYGKLYNRYNSAYKLRNGLYIAYGAWAIYSLLDLSQKRNMSFSFTSQKHTTMLSVTLKF